MTIFIPSCVANICLNFDEDLLIGDVEPLLSSTDTLVSQGGAIAPRLVNQAEAFSRGSGVTSSVLNRVPKKASFSLPGFRQAGQFSLSFDYREFPVDPRLIRSAVVYIHAGTVDPARFAQGMVSLTQFAKNQPSILDTTSFFGLPQSETLALTGYVDNWKVQHTANGSEVTISGRDSRSILLDTPLGGNAKLDKSILDQLVYTAPIHEVIKQLLSFMPFFGDFTAEVDFNEWGGPVPSPSQYGVTAPRHRKGAKGSKAGRVNPPGTSSSMSFWDLIVRLCFLVGAIPYLTGNRIIVRPVRRLYDQQRAGIDPRVQSPFANAAPRQRDAQTGKSLPQALKVRRLVYGRDIEDLSFDRKFGGFAKPRSVRAIGGDDTPGKKGTDRVIMALWPPHDKTKARRSKVSPSGKDASEDFFDYPVPGVRDYSRLLMIAKGIYEEIGRGEVGGSCSTPNLASFGGDNTDPDLLRLKPGDAVELKIDVQSLRSVGPVVSEFTNATRDIFEKRVADVAKRIGDKDLARKLVSTARGQVQELISFFRVSSVSYDWDVSKGFSVDFDFQNYVGRFKADDDDTSPVQEVGGV